ncbi:MAG TPA: LytTR family DNA-binding domain-containing protein [Verrucomicrobiota bacterium]|nr:LytTR family DNA-binding domain-containing protein [Verrucomicrobiota bacterium]
MRVVIADDEPLARERIEQLLAACSDMEIAATAGDGRAAVEAVRAHRPDLLFLDVQMPELDGFGVLAELGADAPPAVIFCTAYDQFALNAFEVHALDYLLKPFDEERFTQALDRARRQPARPAGGPDPLAARLAALLESVRPGPPAGGDRLAVRSEGRVVLVKLADIDWVEAADNYVNLHVGRDSHLMRETMNHLEQRLDPARFARISRSTIVNLDRIRELQPMFHGDYTVVLRDGTKLALSRNYRERLAHLLGR